jgi:hypothetical protein
MNTTGMDCSNIKTAVSPDVFLATMLPHVLSVNVIVSASIIFSSGTIPTEITHAGCHFVGVSGHYLKSV